MAVSAKEAERSEKTIRATLKLLGNKRCVNCDSVGPQYVCSNFNTFVCTICSGIHREFSHRIKSISMSKFSKEEAKNLENGGNQKCRETLLHYWNFAKQNLPRNSELPRLREFIRTVYVEQKYSIENKEAPLSAPAPSEEPPAPPAAKEARAPMPAVKVARVPSVERVWHSHSGSMSSQGSQEPVKPTPLPAVVKRANLRSFSGNLYVPKRSLSNQGTPPVIPMSDILGPDVQLTVISPYTTKTGDPSPPPLPEPAPPVTMPLALDTAPPEAPIQPVGPTSSLIDLTSPRPSPQLPPLPPSHSNWATFAPHAPPNFPPGPLSAPLPSHPPPQTPPVPPAFRPPPLQAFPLAPTSSSNTFFTGPSSTGSSSTPRGVLPPIPPHAPPSAPNPPPVNFFTDFQPQQTPPPAPQVAETPVQAPLVLPAVTPEQPKVRSEIPVDLFSDPDPYGPPRSLSVGAQSPGYAAPLAFGGYADANAGSHGEPAGTPVPYVLGPMPAYAEPPKSKNPFDDDDDEEDAPVVAPPAPQETQPTAFPDLSSFHNELPGNFPTAQHYSSWNEGVPDSSIAPQANQEAFFTQPVYSQAMAATQPTGGEGTFAFEPVKAQSHAPDPFAQFSFGNVQFGKK